MGLIIQDQEERIDFQPDPIHYRHWQVRINEKIATVAMDVDEQGGLFQGYELKLNSYDLGVDIELADIILRLRFEHPEVRAVILRSAKPNIFCAGANIKMLAEATHGLKVNFCKFTNETRTMLENMGVESGQPWLCAVRGACAGGGYELALACDHIILADDGSSSVALPEIPLLAVLPGTGGLTRITDKRKVRRDLADVFCSTEEGIKGKRALAWNLVDEISVNSQFEKIITERAADFAARPTPYNAPAIGIMLPPLDREFDANGNLRYSAVSVTVDRQTRTAILAIAGPDVAAPDSIARLNTQGAENWMLRMGRELDDAILHLRFNEPEIGTLLFKTNGDPAYVQAHERFLLDHQGKDWLATEILLFWKRILKRIDVTSRSLVALVEPGSCFVGTLAEIMLSADRCYMADGSFDGDNRPPATLILTSANFGPYSMANGLTRLETRFLGNPDQVVALTARCEEPLTAQAAMEAGLITFALDDIDWEDEIRIFLEERASFSPDALIGMEANLRFPGPETMETRIFGRLTAWQNWIFQRPNATSETGALKRYGTGRRSEFDLRRV